MPTAVVYVAAAITTVAAVLAFKEFVYEPHIAPVLDEFRAVREERRRQREAAEVPVGTVRDYTRGPRDEKAERARRAAAADAWRRLTDSVSELDSLRGQEKADANGTAVEAPSSAGLRRRTAGPMDESIESILFAPMSPTPMSPTPTPPSRGARSPSPVRPASPDETLFSTSTLSSPELASRPLHVEASPLPRSPSPDPSARVLSPDPFSDVEANPWVTDDAAPSLANSAVFLSPPLPATNVDALAGSDFLMPDGVMSPRSVLAAVSPRSPAADVLSPFTQPSVVATDVDELSLLDEDEAFSVASLSDHSSDSDGEQWTAARREAHL